MKSNKSKACSLRDLTATRQLDRYPQDHQRYLFQEPASDTQELFIGLQEPASYNQEREHKLIYLGGSLFGSVKIAANFGKANQHTIM